MMEVFYTGGGIWLAEMILGPNECAVISSDYPDCLSIYSYQDEDEKYLPENMILSKQKNELDSLQIIVYERLLKELKKVL